MVMTKDGKLSARERDTLLSAARILNKWCDWECDEREKPTFDPTLDDVECNAASAAGMIQEFIWQTRGM